MQDRVRQFVNDGTEPGVTAQVVTNLDGVSPFLDSFSRQHSPKIPLQHRTEMVGAQYDEFFGRIPSECRQLIEDSTRFPRQCDKFLEQLRSGHHVVPIPMLIDPEILSFTWTITPAGSTVVFVYCRVCPIELTCF